MFGEIEKQKLAEWIDAEYDSRAKHLLNGMVKDADYRPTVQYLRALSDVAKQIAALEEGRNIMRPREVAP